MLFLTTKNYIKKVFSKTKISVPNVKWITRYSITFLVTEAENCGHVLKVDNR